MAVLLTDASGYVNPYAVVDIEPLAASPDSVSVGSPCKKRRLAKKASDASVSDDT